MFETPVASEVETLLKTQSGNKISRELFIRCRGHEMTMGWLLMNRFIEEWSENLPRNGRVGLEQCYVLAGQLVGGRSGVLFI